MTADLTAIIAEVLAEHPFQWEWGFGVPCRCGEANWTPTHLAEQIAARLSTDDAWEALERNYADRALESQ